MPAPRIVDTPEKAAAESRSLLRATKRMERIVGELPGYFDDLPPEAQDELRYRLARLRERIDAFRRAR